jgi:4-amino-4-deoxychorismate lyase
MSLLFESIKITNKQPQNLFYHNERMSRTREELFGINKDIDLENIICLPSDLDNDIYKCRITYDKEIRKVSFEKYQKRKITRLKIVECNEIEYGYKYVDRVIFDKLKQQCNCKPDEDIIIIKNGLLADTSFSNIILKKNDKWFTPEKPLLDGTQRAKLLKEGVIFPASICADELIGFEEIGLINAMINFEDMIKLPINLIGK